MSKNTNAANLTITDGEGNQEVVEAVANPTPKDGKPGFSGAKYKRELADVNTGIAHTDKLNTMLNNLAVMVGFREAHEAADIFKTLDMQILLGMTAFKTNEEAAAFADQMRNSAFGKGREEILATVAMMLRAEK